MKTKIFAKSSEAKRNDTVAKTQQTDFSKPINSPVDQILSLQRTIGNQAVQRLFKSGVIQAKLKIGQPNDIYEQEADRLAEQVMRMTEPRLQRQAEEEEKEEEEELIQPKFISDQITPLVQRQLEPEEEIIQPKGNIGQTSEVTPDLESRIQALRGGGQPLPKSARNFFEPRFGYDFSQVRIHSNPEVTEIAEALNAKAFTVGRDIVFGVGYYAPETTSGKKLFAHELTHVVQQSGIKKTYPVSPVNNRHRKVDIHGKIYNAAIQGKWTLTKKSSPGTNCLAYALGLSSTWFPPNPKPPYNEGPFLEKKMKSHGYSRATDGKFVSGKTKVMLVYDLGWPSKLPNCATLANIWKHAMVQSASGKGNWKSQNGIGGKIYVDIDTPIQFVNKFYPPVKVGSQPGGVSLPSSLINKIKHWTNGIEHWIK